MDSAWYDSQDQAPALSLSSTDSALRKRFKIPTKTKGGPEGYAGIAEYDRRFKAQKGLCAICRHPPKNDKRFAVDHNHSSGKVRGLLCSVCNGRILGRLERFKNRASLKQITNYLLQYDPENPLLKGIDAKQ
jgi:hypothetical protein